MKPEYELWWDDLAEEWVVYSVVGTSFGGNATNYVASVATLKHAEALVEALKGVVVNEPHEFSKPASQD